ncbi:MAG: hypothetical protein DRJ01_02990 [Bacteroidetes bacterium]|nr:MAG: hypothetical protein DRJ01_02990 [Bacteroidota bacterium]
MFLNIILFFKRISPVLKGQMFKLFYSSARIKIGKNFQCNTFPHVLINKNCKIIIKNNVVFRRDVELRSHGTSKIVINNNVRIDRGVRILAANESKIRINSGTRIGLYSVLNGGDDINIGEKNLISGFVYLQTSMHNHKKGKSVQEQGYLHSPITLENDVWIGTHAVILPGCNIGQGAVIGSNAVVTKSVSPESVIGGVPAKLIKKRI